MKKIFKQVFILTGFMACCPMAEAGTMALRDDPSVTGELKKWHTVTLTFNGPEVSETDEYNPFLNYRLNVTFSHRQTEKNIHRSRLLRSRWPCRHDLSHCGKQVESSFYPGRNWGMGIHSGF